MISFAIHIAVYFLSSQMVFLGDRNCISFMFVSLAWHKICTHKYLLSESAILPLLAPDTYGCPSRYATVFFIPPSKTCLPLPLLVPSVSGWTLSPFYPLGSFPLSVSILSVHPFHLVWNAHAFLLFAIWILPLHSRLVPYSMTLWSFSWY